MSDSFVTPWIMAHQALLSMGFSRQKYWSGLQFPSPGDVPDLGIKPESPALQADPLPPDSPGKPKYIQMPCYVYLQCLSLSSCPFNLCGRNVFSIRVYYSDAETWTFAHQGLVGLNPSGLWVNLIIKTLSALPASKILKMIRTPQWISWVNRLKFEATISTCLLKLA